MPKAAGANRTGSAIVGSTLTYEARGRFKSYGPKTAVVTQGLMDDADDNPANLELLAAFGILISYLLAAILLTTFS